MATIVDAARYAAASARVHGVAAQLIPQTMWADLLAAPDLPAVTRLLRQSWYAGALTAVDDSAPNPSALERAFWHHWATASRLPLPLLQGLQRDLLEWHWRRFEIENLKAVLRGVHFHAAPSQIQASLIALGSAASLRWETLSSAGTVFAVVDRLRTTQYCTYLVPAMAHYRREGLLYVLEIALDLGYVRRLRQFIHALHGRDRREAQRLLGMRIDADNLLWAYRFRTYARFAPEEILNYTLQRGLTVDAEIVREIVLGAPLVGIVRRLWGAAIPALDELNELSERAALERLELLVQRHLHQVALRTWQSYPLQLGTILAYQVFVEDEIRDLLTVVGGKSFGWTAEQLRPYLIGERG